MLGRIELKLKRIAVALLLVLSTTTSPAWAASGGPGDKGSIAATVSNAPEVVSPAETPANGAPTSLESQLEQLRGLIETQGEQLREQQERILELEASLQPGIAETAPAPAVVAIGPAVAAQAPQAAAPDLAKRISDAEARLRNIGPFSFSGDFRLRDEPYFGGPVNKSQVRNRERYRARLYLNAKLNDDINGGLILATGDNNDPITSNQTANQFFTRKPFTLDRAFINYTPHQFKALTLTGGKFAYPWYRTELTWDNDINPEGVAQKLEWQSNKWKVLRQFALIGFELPFGETSRTTALTTFNNGTGALPSTTALFPYPNSSIHQSVVYGGQIQTRWQLASWLSFTADTAFYNWHNADPIALATQQQDAASPALGTTKLGSSAGNLTNSYQIVTESFTVPVSSGGTMVVNSAIIGAKLNSKFALSDTIAQFDIKTPSAKWPIRLLADYVQNSGACGNNPTVAPLSAAQLATLPANATIVNGGTAGAGLKNGVCDPHERRAHWLESRLGRQAQKGDWQFAYTHMLIDREAVLSVYNFSDIRQGSNVVQNRAEALYQAYNNVQLGFTGFFGRQLGTTNTTETLLKRLQFDVVYRF